MKLSLNDIAPLSLYKFKGESDLISAIAQVHHLFIKDRENLANYINDPRLVAAYAHFYLPTNLEKALYISSKVPKDLLKGSTLVDLGAGPGTFTLGLMQSLGFKESILVEQSSLMLDQAKKILDYFLKDSIIHYKTNIPTIEGKTTLLFGHSFNELGVEKSWQMIEELDPDHILLMEPGTKSIFKEVLDLRERLLEHYDCYFPCPSNDSCPLVAVDDWCHFTLNTSLDPSIERISQKLKLDRRHMPLIFHLYTKGKISKEQGYRYLRIIRETKFSLDLELCSYDGENKIILFELLKKGLSKRDINEFKKLSGGEILHLSITKMISKTHLRGILR